MLKLSHFMLLCVSVTFNKLQSVDLCSHGTFPKYNWILPLYVVHDSLSLSFRQTSSSESWNCSQTHKGLKLICFFYTLILWLDIHHLIGAAARNNEP